MGNWTSITYGSYAKLAQYVFKSSESGNQIHHGKIKSESILQNKIPYMLRNTSFCRNVILERDLLLRQQVQTLVYIAKSTRRETSTTWEMCLMFLYPLHHLLKVLPKARYVPMHREAYDQALDSLMGFCNKEASLKTITSISCKPGFEQKFAVRMAFFNFLPSFSGESSPPLCNIPQQEADIQPANSDVALGERSVFAYEEYTRATGSVTDSQDKQQYISSDVGQTRPSDNGGVCHQPERMMKISVESDSQDIRSRYESVDLKLRIYESIMSMKDVKVINEQSKEILEILNDRHTYRKTSRAAWGLDNPADLEKTCNVRIQRMQSEGADNALSGQLISAEFADKKIKVHKSSKDHGKNEINETYQQTSCKLEDLKENLEENNKESTGHVLDKDISIQAERGPKSSSESMMPMKETGTVDYALHEEYEGTNSAFIKTRNDDDSISKQVSLHSDENEVKEMNKISQQTCIVDNKYERTGFRMDNDKYEGRKLRMSESWSWTDDNGSSTINLADEKIRISDICKDQIEAPLFATTARKGDETEFTHSALTGKQPMPLNTEHHLVFNKQERTKDVVADFEQKGGKTRSSLACHEIIDISGKVRYSLLAEIHWGRNPFYQTLILFPVIPPQEQRPRQRQRPLPHTTSRPGSLNHLMHNEVLRMCSYGYSRFPPNVNVWVTQLAQSGFFCVSEDGRVRCFSCGREYQDYLIGSPLENAHDQRCQRHQLNRPLSEGTQNIREEELSQYFSEYGSLNPQFEGDTESRDSGVEFQDAREVNDDDSHSRHSINTSSGYGSSVSSSRGHEVSDSGLADIREEGEQANETPSAGADADVTSTVSQESSEIRGARQVLTSATKNPVTLDRVPPLAQTVSEQSGDGSEVGAVGGSAPALSYDLSKASYPQFAASQARRMTFANWRSEHTHQPDDLVPAGFFYAGYADCVRCFYCGLGLKYWRADDIPAYQHARFRPHCVFNRMYKGQDYIDRVQQDLREAQEEQGAAQPGTMPARTEAQSAPSLPPPPSTSVPRTAAPAPSTAGQQQDHMRSEAAQAALRSGWSEEQVRRGVEYVVRELGENALQQDILIDVLGNLNQNNGENLTSDSSQESVESEESFHDAESPVDSSMVSVVEPAGAQAPLVQQPAVPELDRDEQFRLVEREHNYLQDRMTCNICKTRPVSCVYLPCGHVIACQECAEQANTCIICQKNIVGTANIYLA